MIDIVEDLDQAIEDALWEYDPVRESLSALKVTADADGTVSISGHVRSGVIKDGVLETLRRVPGITGIVETVYADNEIEFEVARVLAVDPSLKGLSPGTIAVHSHLGTVTLVGKVVDSALQEAATEVAGQIPGVLAIDDRLNST